MRRMARRRTQKIGSKAAGPSNGVEQLLLQGPSKGLAVSSKGVEQLLLLGTSALKQKNSINIFVQEPG